MAIFKILKPIVFIFGLAFLALYWVAKIFLKVLEMVFWITLALI